MDILGRCYSVIVWSGLLLSVAVISMLVLL